MENHFIHGCEHLIYEPGHPSMDFISANRVHRISWALSYAGVSGYISDNIQEKH